MTNHAAVTFPKILDPEARGERGEDVDAALTLLSGRGKDLE